MLLTFLLMGSSRELNILGILGVSYNIGESDRVSIIWYQAGAVYQKGSCNRRPCHMDGAYIECLFFQIQYSVPKVKQ